MYSICHMRGIDRRETRLLRNQSPLWRQLGARQESRSGGEAGCRTTTFVRRSTKSKQDSSKNENRRPELRTLVDLWILTELLCSRIPTLIS